MPAPIAAVMLDRDGTVIVDKHYLADPSGVELLPGAGEGLQALSRAGLTLCLVTNQSGIGRGYFSEEAYQACHAALQRQLCGLGVSLAASAFCPHAPEAGCACRKPLPGMWQALAAECDLLPGKTAMVGDKPEDMAFAHAAGLALRILVLTGKGRQSASRMHLPLPDPQEAYRLLSAAELCASGAATNTAELPHAVAHSLAGAAACILAYSSGSGL